MSNIIIIGMPGSGKSTFGKQLAEARRLDFVDTDTLIEERFGASLQDVVDGQGLAAMLELEQEMICAVEVTHSVVATGGSVVYSEKAMQHLSSLGDIVYLRISVDTMVQRVSAAMERGLFKDPSTTLEELYYERLPLYAKWANITLENDLPLGPKQFALMNKTISGYSS